MIEALLQATELKDEKRTGEQLYSIDDPATVAGHSWAVSLLVMIYGRGEDMNHGKALRMSIVHDLAEAETGDIASRAEKENQVSEQEKQEKELEAMNDFSKSLHTFEVRELWKEYERGETYEARFVNDMDKIENVLQALKYEKEDRYDPEDNQEMDFEAMDEFFEVSGAEIKTEAGREIFDEIEKRYEDEKDED